MENTNALYEKYRDMLCKFTNEYATLYKVDYDELFSEAIIIFCKAVDSFDCERKVAFSTHLWHRLRDLQSKAFREATIINRQYGMFQSTRLALFHEESSPNIDNGVVEMRYNEGIFIGSISCIDFSNTNSELMHDIALELSKDAQTYLSDLFYGTFQEPKNEKGGRPSKFPIDKICKHYKWTKKKAVSVRDEITEWWAEYKEVA